MFKPVSEVTNHLRNFFSTGSPPQSHRCQGETELPEGASQKGRVVWVLVFGVFPRIFLFTENRCSAFFLLSSETSSSWNF